MEGVFLKIKRRKWLNFCSLCPRSMMRQLMWEDVHIPDGSSISEAIIVKWGYLDLVRGTHCLSSCRFCLLLLGCFGGRFPVAILNWESCEWMVLKQLKSPVSTLYYYHNCTHACKTCPLKGVFFSDYKEKLKRDWKWQGQRAQGSWVRSSWEVRLIFGWRHS